MTRGRVATVCLTLGGLAERNLVCAGPETARDRANGAVRRTRGIGCRIRGHIPNTPFVFIHNLDDLGRSVVAG